MTAPAPLSTPFTVLIPARMASSRLPGKPLLDIAGLPMVVQVARRAAASGAARVVVAADDARILEACAAHNVQAIATRADHPSGSDRLAEACRLLGLDGGDIVVNVQGDEPLIAPQLINAVAALLAERQDASMGTAAHAIHTLDELRMLTRKRNRCAAEVMRQPACVQHHLDDVGVAQLVQRMDGVGGGAHAGVLSLGQ